MKTFCVSILKIKAKEFFMKKLIVVALTLAAASTFAGPECTKEPKSKWQDKKKFEENLVTQGYKVKVFKVTDENCYELYGWNKEGKKVEIYFNPVTGKKVKEEIK
jgi:hypothetical protein